MLISVSDLQCNVCFYWNSFCQIHVPSGVQKNALRKLVVNVMTFFSTIYAAQNYEQSSRPTGPRALLIVYSLPHKFPALSQKPPFIPLKVKSFFKN